MKNITWIVLMMMLPALVARTQDMAALSKAFDSSYTYEQNGFYDQAVKVIEKYYEAGSYELNVRLGWLNYLSGKHTESLDYYRKAILLQPYAIEPRLGYALPASALGNWNEVLAQYNKILEVDPVNSYVNYKVGMIYYYREQYDIALVYFEKVANLYPFDYDSTIMYAWTSYFLGKTREAKILFQKALLMRPEDESATEGLGLIK